MKKNDIMNKSVLTEIEAAEFLRLHPTTLRKGRIYGNLPNRCSVPPFIRLGRSIRYLRADLEKFLQQCRITK